MTEAVNSLLRNYPYLEREPDTQPMAVPGSGGSPVNGRRQSDATSPAVLERKDPALRARRWLGDERHTLLLISRV
jgi:hypothetical protein